jgi:NADPH2:quinone reductase
MRAILVSQYGGPEVLAVAERPDPEPGRGEVIVETAAIGVNFLDARPTSSTWSNPARCGSTSADGTP